MWFTKFLKSSIGKKIVMATSGLLLLLFLVTHAAGNYTIFMGRKVFQGYADELHSHPLIVIVFSLGIAAVFLVHIIYGITLFLENRKVSATRYAVVTRTVKNTFASETMPYTGAIILLFLIVHISGFTFAPHGVIISDLVKKLLSGFFYGLFYIICFSALAIHISHGFWSMLQTFGTNHPRYNDLIGKLTYVVPLIFLVIFAGIPVYFITGMGANF